MKVFKEKILTFIIGVLMKTSCYFIIGVLMKAEDRKVLHPSEFTTLSNLQRCALESDRVSGH